MTWEDRKYPCSLHKRDAYFLGLRSPGDQRSSLAIRSSESFWGAFGTSAFLVRGISWISKALHATLVDQIFNLFTLFTELVLVLALWVANHIVYSRCYSVTWGIHSRKDSHFVFPSDLINYFWKVWDVPGSFSLRQSHLGFRFWVLGCRGGERMEKLRDHKPVIDPAIINWWS